MWNGHIETVACKITSAHGKSSMQCNKKKFLSPDKSIIIYKMIVAAVKLSKWERTVIDNQPLTFKVLNSASQNGPQGPKSFPSLSVWVISSFNRATRQKLYMFWMGDWVPLLLNHVNFILENFEFYGSISTKHIIVKAIFNNRVMVIHSYKWKIHWSRDW